MMERENIKAYWCKTALGRDGSLKIIEIYLGEDGLYRVYTDRTATAFVFGSWEAIKEKYPLIGLKVKESKQILM